MSLREPVKIKLISSLSKKERADVLLNAFNYLLVKLPQRIKEQKINKTNCRKIGNL